MKEWVSMEEVLELFRVDDQQKIVTLVEEGLVRRGPDQEVRGRPPIWTYSSADLKTHLSGREKEGVKLDASGFMMAVAGAGAAKATELAISPMFQSVVEIVQGYVATMEDQHQNKNPLGFEQFTPPDNPFQVGFTKTPGSDIQTIQMILEMPLTKMTRIQKEQISDFAIGRNLVGFDDQGHLQDLVSGSGVDAVSKMKIDKF